MQPWARRGPVLLVLPVAGLAVSITMVVLVVRPLSWWRFYGSWPSDGGNVGDALLFVICLFVASVAWFAAWYTTLHLRARPRAVVLVIALVLAPALYSYSSFGTARNRWCEIRQSNGPDPRLNTITGPLAPHC